MDNIYLEQKKKEYFDLCNSEREIKQALQNPTYFDGNYTKYALLDYEWYKKYKQYLFNLVNKHKNEKFNYDINALEAKTEEKIFCFINEKNESDEFNFISDFVLVTEQFINSLSYNFNKIDKKLLLNEMRDIMVGGNCIIRKNRTGNSYNYITFYEENKSNNIDFWLMIKDKKQRESHLNFILNNNLWYYLGFINFNYHDEQKEIYDENGNKIGLFYRNCDSERSKFLDDMKNNNLNNNHHYQQIKATIFVNIELIPKVNSILACLSSFKELTSDLINYSKDNRFKIIKLFANFFNLYPNNNCYNEIKSISGLLLLNKDI